MHFQQVVLKTVDAFYAAIPRPEPPPEALECARLVAHRGAWGKGRPENTLKAFDAALEAGVWGVELDLRWSADPQPIILHDPDCRRVFGQDCLPARLRREELKQLVPGVPELAEVVARYGKRLHLMLEIKEENYPSPDVQSQRLASVLSPLRPIRDYHVLALNPALFDRFPWLPREACVTVSQANPHAMSAVTLEKNYGAFTGHYLLTNRRLLHRHQTAGQRVGVGFPASRNSLIREINRRVDWIFTNHALRLQKHLDRMLRA